jgi:hypothetical protein
MQGAFQRFEHIEQKREKKNIMKAHVYLDALITLHKMPSQIQKSIDVLSESHFKRLNIEALRTLLEKFTDVQEVNKGDMARGKRRHSDLEE